MNKFFLVIALAMIFTSQIEAQIVNIENLRMRTNDQLFLMTGDVSFSYSNNDGNYNYKINSRLGTSLKSKNKNHTYFLIGDYTLNRSKQEDFQNDWFVHLRYNFEQTDNFRWELFTQSQGNQVLDVENRYLLGAGSRIKIVLLKGDNQDNDTGIRFYLGNAYMYEYEHSPVYNSKLYQHRHSSYFSMSINLINKLDVTNTVYYQPLYKDFDDYRVSYQIWIGLPLNDRGLKFTTDFEYSYDSFTPAGRSQFSSFVSFGLSFTLASKPIETPHWHLKEK